MVTQLMSIIKKMSRRSSAAAQISIDTLIIMLTLAAGRL
jgi:hypothetical protein